MGLIWVPVIVGWIALPWLALSRTGPWLGLPEVAYAGSWYGALRWLAALVALACLAATIKSWARMGNQWRMAVTDEPGLVLITDGMFARIRHPIYAFSILLMICTMIVVPTPPMLALGDDPHRAHGDEGAQRGAAPPGSPWRYVRALRGADRPFPASFAVIEAGIAAPAIIAASAKSRRRPLRPIHRAAPPSRCSHARPSFTSCRRCPTRAGGGAAARSGCGEPAFARLRAPVRRRCRGAHAGTAGAAHRQPAWQRADRHDAAVRRIPDRDGLSGNVAARSVRRQPHPLELCRQRGAGRGDCLVLRARRHAADADRAQPGRHARHAHAARARRRISRRGQRLRSGRRDAQPRTSIRDPRTRPRAARRRPEGRVRGGARHRQAAARPARPVVDASEAAQDPRHRGRIHRLHDRVGPDRRQSRRGRAVRRHRAPRRAQRHAAGVVQPHRRADHRASGGAKRPRARGSTPIGPTRRRRRPAPSRTSTCAT